MLMEKLNEKMGLIEMNVHIKSIISDTGFVWKTVLAAALSWQSARWAG
jgi:hypothetical protein